MPWVWRTDHVACGGVLAWRGVWHTDNVRSAAARGLRDISAPYVVGASCVLHERRGNVMTMVCVSVRVACGGHPVWIMGAGLNQKRDKPESQDPNQLNDELRALQRRMFE